METFSFPTENKKIVLALGAESAGNFSVYHTSSSVRSDGLGVCPLPCTQGRAGEGLRTPEGLIHFSQDFGDLLEEKKNIIFKRAVLAFLKKEKITPDIILTDSHPLMKTTLWGEALTKKYKAEHIQIQHHHAHIFSAIGECFTPSPVRRGGLGRGYGADGPRKVPHTVYGIAMDGTGYGGDDKIWGGEVFKVTSIPSLPVRRGRPARRLANGKAGGCPVLRTEEVRVERIGHLENQTLLGGELAIREPARMLISILSKFLSKKEVFNFVKKYYSKNEFEVLYNQLKQNFNCLETSSTGRVLDAVSLLLGFCGNERKYKHAPIDLLEKNSTTPYKDLKPKITLDADGQYILDTNYLFNYVINYLHKKDKRRLAATAQLYIAEGLYEIIQKNIQNAGSSVPLEPHSSGKAKSQNKSKFIASNSALPETKSSDETPELAIREGLRDDFEIFSAGGLANNQIISAYLISKGVYASKKIPRGDAGLSFGQVIYYLLTQKNNCHSCVGRNPVTNQYSCVNFCG